MNKIIKRFYLGLAALCLIFAVLVACAQVAWGQSPWVSKQLWVAMFAAAASAVIAWKCKPAVALNLLAVLSSLLLVELGLQTAGWLGLLPGVNTKIKTPHGRVYWSLEGLGNSVRNSFGWYYPEFNTTAARKIALVGDSFVEAVEIHRHRNEGVILEQQMRAAGIDAAVLAFGIHGTSPAYHRDVIDYAARHFHPDEVVLCIYLGNDVTESSPELNLMPPSKFIYYQHDGAGRLELHPESRELREQFVRGLEFSHHSPPFTLSATISSHVMSVQVLTSLRDTWSRRRAAAARVSAESTDPVAVQIRATGLNPRAFRVPAESEVEQAVSVLLGTIGACRDTCTTNGMTMRLALIPCFPQSFYATQKGRDWTLRFAQYDFQAHERRISAFARSNGIPVLELGQYMKNKQLDVTEIQELYLSGGSGHFSEAGHRYFAGALCETFFPLPGK